MFKVYTKQYYSSEAYVSCYCWEIGDNLSDGFCAAIAIKNCINHEKQMNDASWDSVNNITVRFENESGKIKATYNVITTLDLTMMFDNKTCGNVCLSGSVSRKAKSVKAVKKYEDDAHIGNIGKLVEDLEGNLLSTIESVYALKSKEILETSRYNPNSRRPNVSQAEALRNVFMMGVKH